MTNPSVLMELKTASAIVVRRPAVVIGFIAAVVGPFALLLSGGRESHNLPWYFLGGGLVLLMLFVGVGFLLYTRESRLAKEISISPDRC